MSDHAEVIVSKASVEQYVIVLLETGRNAPIVKLELPQVFRPDRETQNVCLDNARVDYDTWDRAKLIREVDSVFIVYRHKLTPVLQAN